MSDKHHKKAAFGPLGAGRVYARDSAPMPEGRASTGSAARGCFVCGRPQRDHPGGIECAAPASTGSEARQSRARYPMLRGCCGTCQNRAGVICDLCGNGLEPEVVEPDHDERAEGWRCPECGDPHQAYCYRCGTRPDDWQPDPRTVKAVVEALRGATETRADEDGCMMEMHRFGSWLEVADWVAEHFNLTEGRDDDG